MIGACSMREKWAAACRAKYYRAAAVSGLLAIQAGLVAWMAFRNSPTCDEIGHLPAGIAIWESGRFDLYRVNPPLVKVLAALPLVALSPETDWRDYRDGPADRPEWQIGRRFLDANGGPRAFWYFTLARWACVPLVLIGGYVCYRWASDLYGFSAGIAALVLWCFCPNVLGAASTIAADAAAAALGVAAGYAFWRWLRHPNWCAALAAGTLLGLAELTKTTWIILFALWPAIWLSWLAARPRQSSGGDWWREAGQLALIATLGLYLINAGYGFEESFRRLGDFRFVSRTLAGADSIANGENGGNRFTETVLASVPVPLPMNYVRGIDLQRLDFEKGQWCYLRGEWKFRGWWYWYLYAALVKVPLGTWILAVLAALVTGCGAIGQFRGSTGGGVFFAQGRCIAWRDEATLLAPAAAVFALASCQTGFTSYFRYVIPCLPFAFVWPWPVKPSPFSLLGLEQVGLSESRRLR